MLIGINFKIKTANHQHVFYFVKLDAFVIMPNHVHGVVIIDKHDDARDVENMDNVETQNFASLQHKSLILPSTKNKFGPQSKKKSFIIRGFKIGVTKCM